eukprot:Selendium_serpulae@DN6284_c2_g4_i1.p1
MCLRTKRDSGPCLLSDTVRRTGKWAECAPLVKLWDTSPAAQSGASPIFLDVGANLGICSLLMLKRGAKTVAFEPQPSNLFYLTSSLLMNPDVIENVELWPLGLGDSHSQKTILNDLGNLGHSMIIDPKLGKKRLRQNKVDAGTAQIINIRPLDDILWPDPALDPPNIPVAKLDVEGYELFVLRGAKRLLAAKAIKMIKLEFIPFFVHSAGGTAKELCEILINNGFRLDVVGLFIGTKRRWKDGRCGDYDGPLTVEKCEAIDKKQSLSTSYFDYVCEIYAVSTW